MFIDRYKRENVVEYRKTFVKEIKLFLPYFVEFSKKSSILPKEYPGDCGVGRPDQRPIIMIIYYKSVFLANNRCQNI